METPGVFESPRCVPEPQSLCFAAFELISRKTWNPPRHGPLESQTDLGSSGCRLRRLWRDSGGTAAALECFGAPIRVRCVLWPDGRVGGLQGAASFLEHLWLASDSSGEHSYRWDRRCRLKPYLPYVSFASRTGDP